MEGEEQRNSARWEYKLVTMGNPLERGVEERANAFGSQGWELVAIDAGVWVFKRPGAPAAAESEAVRAIVDETVPLVEEAAASTATPTTGIGNAGIRVPIE